MARVVLPEETLWARRYQAHPMFNGVLEGSEMCKSSNLDVAVHVCFAALLLTMIAPTSRAAVWYVKGTSSPVSGSPWNKGYSTIQAAVDHASSGDEVWVVRGTYTGTGDQVVNLKEGVALYGGFSGAETSRGQRDWTENLTIVDGQDARRCVTTVDASTVDGFTLQNGRALQGGGMYYGTAINCTFLENTADVGGGMYWGGAKQCSFQKNSAAHGGGKCAGTAESCSFIRNAAINYDTTCDCGYDCVCGDGTGAGMDYGTATNCIFWRNRAEGVVAYGGAMYFSTAVNCTLYGNEAVSLDARGGGMYTCKAVNCIVWGNSPDEFSGAPPTYSCLSVATQGTGNISSAPALAAPWNGDFRLRASSPCVDKGTSTGTPVTDVLGRVRPTGSGIDMGAYEYYPGDDSNVVTQRVLFVNGACTAAVPDGLSWETAFPTLQAAVDLAGGGMEIWVAQGVYRVATGPEVVHLGPDISLYGGFTGTEPIRDARNPKTVPTVIDGQKVRRCVTGNPSSVVDGFMLQNGSAEEGGGICTGMAVDCVFAGNWAKRGGGAYGSNTTNCTFRENFTFEEGAGAGMYGGLAVNGIFFQNKAGKNSSGGGMYNGTSVNCVFAENSARDGGAIEGGSAINCIFWRNSLDETHKSQVSFSCLAVETEGAGNIVACPAFVNPMAGDFRLRASSPCIDAGSSVPGRDFLGRTRPAGAGMDMGVYEYCQGDDEQAAALPPVLRVRATSTAALPDGLTWETAFPTLQAAADLAGCGAEVWVAQGIYSVVDGEEVIRIDPAISMFGGFTGVETARDARNPDPAATVIDGQATRLCVRAGDTALLNGFTVQNGSFCHYPGSAGMFHGRAENCIFSGNRSCYAGGGLYYGTAVNCTFIGNSADVGGGMDGGAAIGCTFSGNTAGDGGGMGWGTATGCTFIGNDAGTFGGGLVSSTATNCVLSGNIAPIGGGMSDGEAAGCSFVENVATGESFTYGGGGMDGGNAANCLFLRNSAHNVGGGMAGGSAVNCTFFNNSSTKDGGALYNSHASNCILWSDSPNEAAELSDQCLVSFSCSSTPVSGPGNITSSPLFIDGKSGDFRLQSASPCIDAGTGSGAPPTDILGTPRPQGAGYDMGAYEAIPTATVPDLSGLDRAEAEDLIAATRLYVGTESEEFHPTVLSNHVIRQTPPAGVQVPQRTPVDLVISKGPEPVPVPDVVGQTLEAAIASITGAGFVPGNTTRQYSLTAPSGEVISQSPLPGTQVFPEAPVDLTVSCGSILVPDVSGKQQGTASAVLVNAGLVVGTVTQMYSCTTPLGSIVSESPTAGASVLPGTMINMVVSRGVQPSVMPDVVGKPRKQAASAIADADLVLGGVTRTHSSDVEADAVMEQSPSAGTEVPPGTSVSIVVSLGPAGAEGDTEGEPVDSETARQELAAAISSADANGDGMLSFAEAAGAVSGLPQAVFDELDTNRDGKLGREELGVKNDLGCTGCSGIKDAACPRGWKKAMEHLLLKGLVLSERD